MEVYDHMFNLQPDWGSECYLAMEEKLSLKFTMLGSLVPRQLSSGGGLGMRLYMLGDWQEGAYSCINL